MSQTFYYDFYFWDIKSPKFVKAKSRNKDTAASIDSTLTNDVAL